MCRSIAAACLAAGLMAAVPALAAAQQPATPACPCPPAEPPPPPPWTGSIGAGLAFTKGNTDTTNINIAFDLASDPKQVNVFKAEGLYLQGSQDGDDTVDRTAVRGRYERHFSPRTFLFGQMDYVRDAFKDIEYLISPTVGIGRILVDDGKLKVTVDGGLGVVWEKDTDFDVQTSGAVTAGEAVSYKLSDTATITHSTTALWKMDDFGDGLYTFRAGIAAGLTKRSQVKLEFIDTLKTRPPTDLVQKNDVAFVSAIVYKF
jgi:putative salt-induced outer membrane protein YdiY